jgi:hypothetical protein
MPDDFEQLRTLRPDVPQASSAELTASRAALVHAANGTRPARTAWWRRRNLWAPALASVAVAAVVATVVLIVNDRPSHQPTPAGALTLPTSTASPTPRSQPPSRARESATPRATSAPIAPPRPSSSGPISTPPMRTTEPTPTETPAAGGAGTRPAAVAILHQAANQLRSEPRIATPAPSAFYYFRTTQSENWISINGRRVGTGRTPAGDSTWPACRNGRDVTPGESGSCTAHPAYLPDAPTATGQWASYLDKTYLPGALESGAGGKAVYQLLYTNLVQPAARASLLDWVATCADVRTVQVAPVDGRQLVGVSCADLPYLVLVFDRSDHHLAGTIWDSAGPAELWLQTGVVAAVGDRP